MDEILLVTAFVLAFIILMSGCALLYLYLRAMRFSGSGGQASTGDLTNIMILFQSMRETLEQQKELARNFNLSIDQKVGDIRKTLDEAKHLSERVSTAETELNNLVGSAKEELASVKRRLGYLQDQMGVEEAPPSNDNTPTMINTEQIEDTLGELSDSIAALDETPQEATVQTPVTTTSIAPVLSEQEEIIEEAIPAVMDAQGNVVPYDGSSTLPPLNAIASIPSTPKNFIDHWTGVDFGAAPRDEPAKIAEVDEPEDPEASRDAFRALLNMQSNPPADALVNEATEPFERDLSPMQRRVYEFSDAGMRVAEISRELGVGKGEVKLILNMRKKQH